MNSSLLGPEDLLNNAQSWRPQTSDFSLGPQPLVEITQLKEKTTRSVLQLSVCKMTHPGVRSSPAQESRIKSGVQTCLSSFCSPFQALHFLKNLISDPRVMPECSAWEKAAVVRLPVLKSMWILPNNWTHSKMLPLSLRRGRQRSWISGQDISLRAVFGYNIRHC